MSERTQHAGQEALSAFLDGEAPEWAAHVAGCPACAASAERLRAVSAAVAAPVEPATAAVREAALSAALGRGPVPATNDAVRGRAARRKIQAPWMLGAVAAIFLVVLGVTALLNSSGRSSTARTTTAAPAFESNRPTAPGNGVAADSAAPTAPITDLGDVGDAATLLARARPTLGAKSSPATGSAASSSNAGGSSATGAAGAAGPASALPAPVVAPNPVGTRPCETQARARQPSLGSVVYFATARRQGVPAVVLGFSTGPNPAPVTLLMLAQDGCGELLRAVGP